MGTFPVRRPLAADGTVADGPGADELRYAHLLDESPRLGWTVSRPSQARRLDRADHTGMGFRVGQVATTARVEEVVEDVEGEAGGQEGEAERTSGWIVTVVANSSPGDAPDADLVTLLGAVRDADPDVDVDSALLARYLSWPAQVVAERLTEARQRMLLWGVRVGGRPGPCYASIELTVQGGRLLRHVDRVERDA